MKKTGPGAVACSKYLGRVTERGPGEPSGMLGSKVAPENRGGGSRDWSGRADAKKKGKNETHSTRIYLRQKRSEIERCMT